MPRGGAKRGRMTQWRCSPRFFLLQMKYSCKCVLIFGKNNEICSSI